MPGTPQLATRRGPQCLRSPERSWSSLHAVRRLPLAALMGFGRIREETLAGRSRRNAMAASRVLASMRTRQRSPKQDNLRTLSFTQNAARVDLELPGTAARPRFLTLQQMVENALRRAILDGQVHGGQKLTQLALAGARSRRTGRVLAASWKFRHPLVSRRGRRTIRNAGGP